MILDSSAVLAILRDEPEAEAFAAAIERSAVRRMSAVSWVESAIVVDGARDAVASRRFDELIVAAQIELREVDREQARLAREAYRDFGKGSGHPARLNFGDCFSYALAKVMNEPLLFKGNDFTHTDIAPASG